MPEVSDSFSPRRYRHRDVDLIQWHTVTYRSVALGIGGLLLVLLLVAGILFPESRKALVGYLFAPKKTATSVAVVLPRQARFTNLEGGVRVKKASEVQWNTASVSMELQEGDTVQTAHDGMARIAFGDGTLYVVKPDTLIVLEQTAKNEKQNVAVHVTSGVVDLSTSRVGGGSRVLFANAEARIRQESRAMVSNDPESNTHQITISRGAASLRREGQEIEIAQYEQASFAGPGSRIVKEKFLAPPVLLTPANAAPVVMTSSQTSDVDFAWSAVPAAYSYRLRISASPTFSSTIYDKRLRSTSVRVSDLKEGSYYWSVIAVGKDEKESQSTEPNQFSVIHQQNQGEIPLLVDNWVQHGRVIEIIGRTEPGATVLVNNETVFSVDSDGSFKHFTNPLPNRGPNLITITAQNSKGQVATLRKTVTIQ